jgi:hypothetical protein
MRQAQLQVHVQVYVTEQSLERAPLLEQKPLPDPSPSAFERERRGWDP